MTLAHGVNPPLMVSSGNDVQQFDRSISHPHRRITFFLCDRMKGKDGLQSRATRPPLGTGNDGATGSRRCAASNRHKSISCILMSTERILHGIRSALILRKFHCWQGGKSTVRCRRPVHTRSAHIRARCIMAKCRSGLAFPERCSCIAALNESWCSQTIDVLQLACQSAQPRAGPWRAFTRWVEGAPCRLKTCDIGRLQICVTGI
jgi:hypothetical protein